MSQNAKEVSRRTAVARAAIEQEMNDADSSVALFMSHHLSELDASYWTKHTKRSRPTSKEVVDLLVLKSHWGADEADGMDAFDFTLPDDATNYLISVRFDDDGAVESVDMES